MSENLHQMRLASERELRSIPACFSRELLQQIGEALIRERRNFATSERGGPRRSLDGIRDITKLCRRSGLANKWDVQLVVELQSKRYAT